VHKNNGTAIYAGKHWMAAPLQWLSAAADSPTREERHIYCAYNVCKTLYPIFPFFFLTPYAFNLPHANKNPRKPIPI